MRWIGKGDAIISSKMMKLSIVQRFKDSRLTLLCGTGYRFSSAFKIVIIIYEDCDEMVRAYLCRYNLIRMYFFFNERRKYVSKSSHL